MPASGTSGSDSAAGSVAAAADPGVGGVVAGGLGLGGGGGGLSGNVEGKGRASGQSHGHSHGHVHGGGAWVGARHAGKLRISFGLIVAFLVVQAIIGLATNSPALLSDDGHVATDALGMEMALAAISAASRHSEADHRTFVPLPVGDPRSARRRRAAVRGCRYVLFEASFRFTDDPHIATTPILLLIGILGLAVNVGSFLLLREGAKESLNLRDAYLQVVSDTVGVIVAAIVMRIIA